MDTIIDVLKSLSDKTRLRIMAVLFDAQTALCICEVVDALKVPQYAVSKHMKELKRAGLVRESRCGRFVFYALTSPSRKVGVVVSSAIGACDAAAFAADRARLKKRLALRAGGCDA